jgi:hypothetical protein
MKVYVSSSSSLTSIPLPHYLQFQVSSPSYPSANPASSNTCPMIQEMQLSM